MNRIENINYNKVYINLQANFRANNQYLDKTQYFHNNKHRLIHCQFLHLHKRKNKVFFSNNSLNSYIEIQIYF